MITPVVPENPIRAGPGRRIRQVGSFLAWPEMGEIEILARGAR